MDACACKPLPVNYWRLPDGKWIEGEQLSPEHLDGKQPNAERYMELGCTDWLIACPECGKRYAYGTTTKVQKDARLD